MGRDDNFDVKPCMIDMNDRCVDFGIICCNTIEDRVKFNEYITKHGLPEELKFDLFITSDLTF